MTTATAVDKFQPATVSNLPAVRGAASQAVFVPTDFGGVMEMAKLMAQSGPAVPKHLRQNPGMCLSVAMTAYQNAFNPFLLAGDTYIVNDVLAYGAKSITAMVHNAPRLAEIPDVAFSGEWPNRVASVTGKIRGPEGTVTRKTEVKANTITVRNSPLWKSQPDQQLTYYAQRAWARAWMPGVLLGMLGDDEVAPLDGGDITPRPTRASMASGGGFAPENGGTIIDAKAGEVDPQTGEIHEPPADGDEVAPKDIAVEVADEKRADPNDIPAGTYTVKYVYVGGKVDWDTTLAVFRESVAKSEALDILNALLRDNAGDDRLLTVLNGGNAAQKGWARDLMVAVNDRKSAIMSATPETGK